MKSFFPTLLTVATLLLAQPATAQFASQEFCDDFSTERSDLVALNSGWCHDVEEPFVLSLYEAQNGDLLLAFASVDNDDPLGFRRAAVWILGDETPRVAVVIDGDWLVVEYLEGDAGDGQAYSAYLNAALNELTHWRRR